jgi:thiamine-monophosphate kinase
VLSTCGSPRCKAVTVAGMPDPAARLLYEKLCARATGLTLADIGEKRLLEEFLLPLCRAASGEDQGIGDDGAVVAMPFPCDLVISTDRVPTDLLAKQYGLMTPEDFGRYVSRVNVSDLVAMGARPAALVVTSAFPPATGVGYVVEMMWGCYDEGRALGAPAVGGDTKSAGEESVSACAFGTVRPGRALRRGPIQPRDVVYVTGPLGRAGAALRWLGGTDASRGEARERLHAPPGLDARLTEAIVAPRPRTDLLDELQVLEGIAGCMDITDGLGQSLVELSDASCVRISVGAGMIPLDPAAVWAARALAIAPLELVGGIGLDLELVIVMRGESRPPAKAIRIGEVLEGRGVVVRADDGAVRPFPIRGFEHFRLTASDYLEQPPQS